MIRCPACGEENPPKFKLCGYCGAALAAAAALPSHEVRKTITILFSDLKDSTALGERLDSEALHEVKGLYFRTMAEQIERHGGKIEKYIGDAIMAVFGLPRVHEDDALRAVRAAADMHAALVRLNRQLDAQFGVVLACRTGVNTGEVVASDDPTADQNLATGDAVNLAARLEQAAPPNEVYVGETTWQLVRDDVDVEAVAPLTLKGKSQPTPAYRLVGVRDARHAGTRAFDAPVIGRAAELTALTALTQDARSARRARMLVVLGDAGIGKSRLIRTHLDRVEADVRVVEGRCLPYGEGITFWPVRLMLIDAAGIAQSDTPDIALAKIRALIDDDGVADRLASAAALGAAVYPLHDVYWAVRKLFERLARSGPLIAFFDDLHWAEPALLDLLNHLCEAIDDAPVVLLCAARHELIETHPEFAQRPGAQRMVVQPLGAAATAEVVARMLAGASVPASFVERIAAASEGNPLYIEQMMSMLIEHAVVRRDDAGWHIDEQAPLLAVPPTIHALLQARLDQLNRSERAVAEPAAVIGLEFQRPAIEALAPAVLRNDAEVHLAGLERKQFVRRVAQDAPIALFRFSHHLVRDTVYGGLLKRARIGLHVAFVRWADALNQTSDRGREFEAILGYHLEQAHRYLSELGPLDAEGIAIGRDAARRLASAGRRAFGRGDMHAAANLYGRACARLDANDPGRAALLCELGETLIGVGNFAGAREALDDAIRSGALHGDTVSQALARLVAMFVRLYAGDRTDWSTSAIALAEQSIPVLEQAQAHHALATAWRLTVLVHGIAGRYTLATDAAARSLHHARLAGDERLVSKNGLILATNAVLGSLPAPDGIAACEAMLRDGLGDRQVESKVRCLLAQLHAMAGDLAAARAQYAQGRAALRDLGTGVFGASTCIDVAIVELHGGDLSRAACDVGADVDFLQTVGETYYFSTAAALLGQIVRDLGDDASALTWLDRARASSADDDIESQALWRTIRAPIEARTGALDTARGLADEAIALARRTEATMLLAQTLYERACVARIAGDLETARRDLDEALTLLDAKGNRPAAQRCRAARESIDALA